MGLHSTSAGLGLVAVSKPARTGLVSSARAQAGGKPRPRGPHCRRHNDMTDELVVLPCRNCRH
jgi:hypothetical protein